MGKIHACTSGDIFGSTVEPQNNDPWFIDIEVISTYTFFLFFYKEASFRPEPRDSLNFIPHPASKFLSNSLNFCTL